MAEAATIARPYAKAAFQSARDSQSLPAWSEALQKAAGMMANAQFSALLGDPKLSADQVVDSFAGLGGADIDARWQNFVRLLTQNKRLEVLPQVAAQYEMLKASFENEIDVEVTSAIALNGAQQGKLAAALKKRFKRDVRISTAVDPKLLGGAVIRAGDLVIDGSINGRLQRLAADLGS